MTSEVRGVPHELTTFVGRRRELAEGRRMLRTARVVTLVGSGGVGKTRTAVRLVAQAGRTFRDGVVMVELAGLRDPDAVASQVAAVLRADLRGRSAQQAVAAYLSSRRLLLVLDNCEHLVDACRELVDEVLAHSPEVRVLTTSRQPLRVRGEHVIPIGPLAVPTDEELASGAVGHVDSVVLLVQRARAVGRRLPVGPDTAAVLGRLCQRLEGIPLAIELAAARLRVLSWAQLDERLDDRYALLSSGRRGGPSRHQTLRAMVDWSHDLCSPAEQRLWAWLSVFEGGADLEAVEAVCARPGVSVSEALAGLTDKSLVIVTEESGRPRFRMLETIREYGAQQLVATGHADQARDRHCDHYLAVAREADESWVGPDQLDRLARVTGELDNLRAALDHAVGLPTTDERALRLVSALGWYWMATGTVSEGVRWFGRALDHDRGPAAARLCALADGAWVAGVQNDLETMTRLAGEAEGLEPGGDPLALSSWHRARSMLSASKGEYDQSVAESELARAGYAASGLIGRQLDHLSQLAVVTMFLGRHQEAADHLADGLALCAARGDHRRAAVLLGALHRVRSELGHQPGVHLADELEATEATLHDALSDEEFDAATAEGSRLSPVGTVRLALGAAPAMAPATAPSTHAATTVGASAALSRRERQVAELLARGLSNKDIAGELVISQRTAESHVARVLDKLGLHTRSEVAARLAGRGVAQE